MSMYNITEEGESLIVWRLGEQLMRLSKGVAVQIYLTWLNITKTDEKRADDFIYGVQLGLTHCAFTSHALLIAEDPRAYEAGNKS